MKREEKAAINTKMEPIVLIKAGLNLDLLSRGFDYKMGKNLIGLILELWIKYCLKSASFQRNYKFFEAITNGRKRRKIRKS